MISPPLQRFPETGNFVMTARDGTGLNFFAIDCTLLFMQLLEVNLRHCSADR
jgi:hypothetical protein